MPEVEIHLKVNRREVTWRVHPGETLLEALHAHHFKGTKLICGTGDCCGCGILLDGRSINSCCMLAAQANGSDLLTIEGLAQDGKLNPIQEAFAEEGAAQCGYGTSSGAANGAYSRGRTKRAARRCAPPRHRSARLRGRV